ncbi:hypothetical protein DX980_01280 [Burkholderia gladioli]|uniref:hypothetical protein n=2 Tax=Burkholderia gladioli TaxID=28095 RepID=UPI001364A844|nr:hypothetical protein [Burkholderia gladioli]MDN7499756.1 hypothetical protein [Burkholderia gladioli]WAG18000.1 hypothetical protein DX980_01280 [Burkholderia gladioli]
MPCNTVLPMPSATTKLSALEGAVIRIEIDSMRMLVIPEWRDGPAALRHAAAGAAGIGELDAVLLSGGVWSGKREAGLPAARRVYASKPVAACLGCGAVGLAAYETGTLCRDGLTRLLVTATPAGSAGDAGIGFVLGSVRPGDLLYLPGVGVSPEGVTDVADRFAPRAVLLGATWFVRRCGPGSRDHDLAWMVARAFPDAVLLVGDGWPEAGRSPLAGRARPDLAGRLTFFRKGRPLTIT